MRGYDEGLRRARRAYERGRVLRGLRTAALVIPMVILSFGGCGSRVTSIAIGSVLAVLVTSLVWRGGIAGRAVAPGLLAGVAPLVMPLLACRVLERAGVTGLLPLLACILGGVGSGAIVTSFAAREREDRAIFVLVAGAVAALAGSVGCLEVGASGIVAMTVGLALIAPLGLGAAPRAAG